MRARSGQYAGPLLFPPVTNEVAQPRSAIADSAGRRIVRTIAALVPRHQRQRLLGPIAALWYRGREFECVVCGGTFRTFRLAETSCPRCGALDRTRLLCIYLEHHRELLPERTRLLHFAPEYGLQRWLRARPGVEFRSADLDSPLADDKVDITDMPYEDASFDAVLCSHVLEHVSDDRAAIREIYRVLRPGGWAILMVPFATTAQHIRRPPNERANHRSPRLEHTIEDPTVTDPSERTRLFGQFDHVRLYGMDFPARVEEAGFEVREDRFVGRLPADLVHRARLNADDDIYLCTKPAPRLTLRA